MSFLPPFGIPKYPFGILPARLPNYLFIAIMEPFTVLFRIC